MPNLTEAQFQLAARLIGAVSLLQLAINDGKSAEDIKPYNDEVESLLRQAHEEGSEAALEAYKLWESKYQLELAVLA